MKPKRIQLSRRKGWRKPENTVVVSRPSKWGNPYTVSRIYSIGEVVKRYREYITTGNGQYLLAQLSELRGHNLACWCALDAPCHADVLLELANS